MPKILAAACVAFSALAMPGMAAAQGAPGGAPENLRPTRDVAVTYRLAGVQGAEDQVMRMAWSTTEGKQRVDPPGGTGYMLIDRGANSAVMVMEPQRVVLALPSAAVAAMSQDAPPDARFTRKGTAQIAGQGCTEWDVAVPQATSTICVTADGVMLRAVSPLPNGGGASRLEATEVRYGAQDSARFRVPEGFQRMQMPAPGEAPPAAAGAGPAAPAR